MRSSIQRRKTRQSFKNGLRLEEEGQIEIFVSCQNLKLKTLFPKHLPSVALYVERDGVYELKGRTEEQKKNFNNPTFTNSFNVNCIPSLKQNIRFLVLATDQNGSDQIVGVVHTTLDSFLGKGHPIAVFDILKRNSQVGQLTLMTDLKSPVSNLISMNVYIEDIQKPKKKFFQKSQGDFSFQLLRPIGNSGDYVPVYESEIKKCRALHCDDIDVEIQKLCNGDHNKLIKLHLLEHTSSSTFSIVGEAIFTINDLINEKNVDYTTKLVCPETEAFCGIVSISEFELIENPHFNEFISAGLRLNLLLGIDYTISNGDPKTTESLHSLKLEGPNEYEKAIKGVFESLLVYSEDKKVRMFGFGGNKISSESDSEKTSHCFPLITRDKRIHATGLDGVLQVYRDSLKKVEFGSPSYLEHLIHQGKKIAKYLQDNEKNEYVVLTILTDGKCHDMADTINKIVEVSGFPLSVMIIGLGKSDFSKMEILGGPHGLLDKRGNRSKRSVVHFTQFRKFQNSPILLGRNIMEKVSDQVLEYMFHNMILPKDIAEKKRIGDELDLLNSEVGHDSCEEDKNRNIFSFSRNKVNMNKAFFKTFESFTQDTGIFSGDPVFEEDRIEIISSFYVNQGTMKPNFLKHLCLKIETSKSNMDYEESETTETRSPSLLKSNIGHKYSYSMKKDLLNLNSVQSPEQRPSDTRTTLCDADA